MSRNIVRHLRFSKSEYEAVSRKAEYLKMPKGRFIRKIAVQGNLKRYDLYELRKITRAFRYCGDSLEQIRKIAETANGDVRTALNGLEVAVLTTNIGSDGYITITDEIAKQSVQNRKAIFDKKGDSHYDNISAFIKSMRGSDPDAAIFYLARALNGGEDPMFLARRIVIAASDDVGMANHNAFIVATSAMEAVHMVGMPEARIILAEAAVYVATSKKSNASYLAINQALEDVANKDTGEVPMHIRNAPAEGMEKEGYHVGYKYPHDYPGHYVEQQYLPDKMLGTKYYIKDENIPD